MNESGSFRRTACGLLTFVTLEAVLLADPVRPWLPFSVWTLDDSSLSLAGVLSFIAVAFVGAFIPAHFPGLRPMPATFPLIGACLILYGMPPAAGLAVATVALIAIRKGGGPEISLRKKLTIVSPTLAGIGLGLLTFDISGYSLPAAPISRGIFALLPTLATGALIMTGAILSALVARRMDPQTGRDSGMNIEWNRLLGGGLAATVMALAAVQAVRIWGLGPVGLWAIAPVAAMAPAAMAFTRQSRARDAAMTRVAGLTEILEAVALAIEAKDRVSAYHIKRMRVLAAGIGRRLGLNEEDLRNLDLATLLHDVGKLAVPEWILSKPGSLTEEEYQKMTAHSETGSRILEMVPFADKIAPLVRHHHEHFDGTGYPAGLAGLEIPLGARILAVVDALDSISSERAYHHALGLSETIAYLQSKAGTRFDPRVVRVLVENLGELEREMEAVAPRDHGSLMEGEEGTDLDKAGAALAAGSEKLQTVLDTIASAHMEIYSLHEIGQALGKTLNVEESLTLIAGRLRSLFHYSACAVFVVDRERGVLVPRLAAGLAADRLRELEIPLGDGFSGWAASERRSIVGMPPSEPLLEEAARSDFDSLDDRTQVADLVSCVAAPLMADQELVGVLALYDTARAPYSSAEERLLTMVGRQVGTAVRTGLLFESTQEHTLTDFLTGLPNARYMFVAMEEVISRAKATGEPLSVLMMDLNGFGALNEEFGHSAGDRFLIGVSKVIRSQMRDPDTCVRYSGDEFLAILPGVGREEAIQVAERIRSNVEAFKMDGPSRRRIGLTISVGHATYSLDGTDLDDILAAAQDRLSTEKTMRRARQDSPSQLLPFRRHKDSSNN